MELITAKEAAQKRGVTARRVTLPVTYAVAVMSGGFSLFWFVIRKKRISDLVAK